MKRFPFAIILTTLLASVIFAVYVSRSRSAKTAAPTFEERFEKERLPTTGAEPPNSRGANASTVTLEEFADFECPACGKFYPILKSIEAEYGNRIRVVFREFPLSQHVHAMTAARAAEAAGMQGKFWEMHDLLYQDTEKWTKAPNVAIQFEEYAKRIGLDVERFKHDQVTEEVKKRIMLDHVRGVSMKLHSTPTLYLNGQEVPWEQMKSVDELRMVIEKALPPSQ
jgi:protein-disulfide isomerase